MKEDVICDIIPPVPGVPGIAVTGDPVPPNLGAEPVIPQGRNTVVSEDGKHLPATKAGHVEFTGHNFQVNPVLQILKDVDQETGDINFLGDVHIHGDVTRGFTVRATGNIQVDGVIESCMVEIVSSGVQGQDCAIIRAHKSIYAKYLERCRVYALESVQADCIIDCTIYSNGTVKARTGRGVIIGGIIRSAHEVSATIVGSKVERLTSIFLGGLPCEESERTEILSDLDRISNEISILEEQPDSPSKQAFQASSQFLSQSDEASET